MTFVLDFEQNSGTAAYKQLANSLRKAILTGRLQPGDQMPSLRELAASTASSIATVNRSFEELSSQHYIETIPGRGTFVSKRLPEGVHAEKADEEHIDLSSLEGCDQLRLSPYGQALLAEDFCGPTRLLHHGAPLLEDLPLSRWKEMLTISKKFEDNSLLAYETDALGYRPLREEIAGFLQRSRSIKCSPDQVAIFPQVEGGTDLLCRLLLRAGDSVAVEDPCGYPSRVAGFRAHGARIVFIPVDDEGMKIDQLERIEPPPQLVHVTPSHQDPTGAQLSVKRRQQLLHWSNKTDALILENDYDCEYRYDDQYLPAIKSMDEQDRVIYRYTFWRVMYPLVRMSLLVVPARLAPLIKRAKQFIGGESQLLEQKVLADFIHEGHLEKHIQRTRAAYQLRRVALIRALTVNFGKLHYATGGMHLRVEFPPEFSSEDILSCAAHHGVHINETMAYYKQLPPRANEFLLGFAYYPDPETIEATINRFAEELHGLSK